LAWSVPLTAVANSPFTAAQFNASVRDNLLMTAPALATTSGAHFAATGANAIAQRISQVDSVATSENTGSSTFVALTTPGGTVTVTSGATCLVAFGSQMFNNTLGAGARMGFEVNGATTLGASDAIATGLQSATASAFMQAYCVTLQTGLTPGSNIFASRYKSPSGVGTATFSVRRMTVVPF
jgi:hypothetical protein